MKIRFYLCIEIKIKKRQNMSNWGRLPDKEDKQWQSWENDYMPASGKADTLAGEIIRAMDRIVYRWYNDGDTVDEYGGSEYNHCKGANIFLMDHVPGFETLEFFWGSDFHLHKWLKKHWVSFLDTFASSKCTSEGEGKLG